MFSTNLRGVNWQTIAWELCGLQLILAVLVLKVPAVYWVFELARSAKSSRHSSASPTKGRDFRLRRSCRGPPRSIAVNPGIDFIFVFAFQSIAAHPVRVGILHRPLPFRHFAMVRSPDGSRHGLFHWGPAGARGNTLSVSGQRLHGSDGGAADRQALCAAHDEFRAVRSHGQRHGPYLRRHDGRLHQLWGRSGGGAYDLCDGLSLQPLPGEALPAGNVHTRDRGDEVHTQAEKSPFVNAIDARNAAAGTTDGLRLALNVAADVDRVSSRLGGDVQRDPSARSSRAFWRWGCRRKRWRDGPTR